MHAPAFFLTVPHIRLRDPLALFLGASLSGVLDYGYLDAVKLAGHSCPTVAGAFGMTRRALAALYRGELPERGGVAAAFRDAADAGVTGVIANVVSMITGAAGEGGFKGLGGRFSRRGLLSFQADVPLEVRFTRADTGAAVDAAVDLRRVPGVPGLPESMQQAMSGAASHEELIRFGDLWQERVRRILLEHADDPEVFLVRDVPKEEAQRA